MNPSFYLRRSLLTAGALGIVASANAADFTWGGGDLNWTDTSASGWNGGPPSTGDNATINSGTVTLTVNNQVNLLNSVTIGGTGKLTQTTDNTWSDFNNLTLSGGTLESTQSTAGAFGSYQLSNTVTVTGSTPSTINTINPGNIFINLGLAVNNSPTFTTFDVADVTANTDADLTVSTVLADNIATNFVSFSTAGLIKTGAGTMALAAANTYSGVTTIAAGTLNAATFSDYGVAGSLGNRVADSGPGNVGILFRGGTLQYTGSTAQSTDRAIRIGTEGATIDASGSVPAATLSFTGTSSPDFFYDPGNRTLTLTGSNTGDNTFAMAIEEVLGNTSFVKSGSGTWVLTGTNSYTGDTTVTGGTLKLGNGTENSNLANTADVIVDSGCTLHLDFDDTDSIDELWLGGVRQNAGTYGAGTYSGVTIAGTGFLNVLNGPPIADPFLAWIDPFFPGETNPLIIGATADPDNDGIENLVEYVLKNGEPDASSTAILPTLDASGANFVFTYFRRTAATGTTQIFQYGNSLSGWTDVPVIDGGIVSITSPEAGIEQVVVTVAKGANTKLFGRLQVVK